MRERADIPAAQIEEIVGHVRARKPVIFGVQSYGMTLPPQDDLLIIDCHFTNRQRTFWQRVKAAYRVLRGRSAALYIEVRP